MAFTHSITQSWSGGAGSTALNVEVSQSADSEQNLSTTVETGVTDGEATLSVDFSAMLALYISSTEDILIETNDGTTPDDALTITADVPLVWTYASGITNPITADIVTNIFITNASGSTATVEIRILQDGTP